MKRKLTAILLASVLAGTLLAGCGGAGNGAQTQSPENAAEAVSEAVPAAESTPVAESAVADTAAVSAAAADTAAESAAAADTTAAAKTDEELAAECAALIDAIYVQERTETTDADIAAARAAWDALTDEQKAMVEGEEADPDYFGRDTGDASADDPLNADESRKLCRKPTLTGPCAGHLLPRSLSIMCRLVTERPSTTSTRLWPAQRRTASKTWSFSPHT